MRSTGRIGIAALVAALALCGWANAQDDKPKAAAKDASGTYQVDTVHSTNWFRITHMGVSAFYGRFDAMEGSFTWKDDNPAGSSFDIRVKVESIDTNNAARDKHLRSKDFFDVDQYPMISFKSSTVKKAGDGVLEVAGDLTLHGVTKPLTVKIQRVGAGPGMKGEFRLGWETTFEVSRKEFGMSNMPGALGDDVRLTVSVEGVRE
jgi:polyisoprenoid-binding protein YceI